MVYHSEFLRLWPQFLAVFGRKKKRLSIGNGDEASFVDEIRLFEFVPDEEGKEEGEDVEEVGHALRKTFQLPEARMEIGDNPARITQVLFW